MNKEIEIPEGYEARIEGNKVIIELKESEDEKIRLALIQIITEYFSNNINVISCRFDEQEFLAYLEKQKEQKPIEDVVKDVTKNKESATKFLKSAGIMDDNGELAEMYRSEQKPAEWSEDERIRKSLIKYVYCHGDAGDFTKKEFIAYLEKQKEYKSLPLDLSIEDVEIIKTALRKSGLESPENREVYDKLEKIPASAYYLSTVERSELYPDGRVERHIIGYLVKQKEQKPAEWSKKDERNLYNTIEAIKYSYDVSEGSGGWSLINWLKYRLRHQSYWKPSEEQMDALSEVIGDERMEDTAACEKKAEILESLYDDLEKL